MTLISSHLEYSIHHKQVKSEGQFSSKGWEKQMFLFLSELHIPFTPCTSLPSHCEVPQSQGSPAIFQTPYPIPGVKQFKQLFSYPITRNSPPGRLKPQDIPCQFVLGTKEALGKVFFSGSGEVLGPSHSTSWTQACLYLEQQQVLTHQETDDSSALHWWKGLFALRHCFLFCICDCSISVSDWD